MNYMGDALLTTPALAALRQAYPDAQIDTVVGAGAAAEVLRGQPGPGPRHRPHGARKLGARRADCTGCCARGATPTRSSCRRCPPMPLAAWLARTPRRVGQARPGHEPVPDRPAPTQRRPHGRRDAGHHAACRRSSRRAPPPGRHRGSRTPGGGASACWPRPGSDADGPLIAVNVGATRPAEALVCRVLRRRRWTCWTDVPCVLVGAGADDAALAAEVLRLTQRASRSIWWAAPMSRHLAALLQRCDPADQRGLRPDAPGDGGRDADRGLVRLDRPGRDRAV